MSEHHHTEHDSGNPSDVDRRPRDEPGEPESDAERVAQIAADVGAENRDPITRREAIELELEDEDLSEAGETLGEHVE
jgi:hypothetical protein